MPDAERAGRRSRHDRAVPLAVMLLGGLLMLPGCWALLLFASLLVKSDPLLGRMMPIWLLCVALFVVGAAIVLVAHRRWRALRSAATP